MKKAVGILGMAMAMEAMSDSSLESSKELTRMGSLIPEVGGHKGGFYSIGKTEMTKAQKSRRKKSKLAKKARRNNR